MLKKTLVALAILAALLAGAWLLLSSRREDADAGRTRPDPAQIRGEPINAVPPAAPALAVATPTNSPPRRKRPKPPSVQRRMVLARLSLSDNPNMDDMPAGTAGTAADLMRTNLAAAVHMTGKGVKAIMDRPIAVAGTLHVGPSQDHGLLAGIYALDGDRVLGSY